ncbi:hypothetical protein CEXT_287501 [Caerostris extrusa]|uniref:BTB domain-containing protein n=1 Tax=Caerostris extrusa TaxID=172846 RepID=A0AAV4PZ82_CAEEX|nr:hypothetical protein CEXT_287501 [Caerostris extrusa]
MDFFGENVAAKYYYFHWTIRDDFQIWDIKHEVVFPSYPTGISYVVTLNPARRCGYLVSTLTLRATQDTDLRLSIYAFCNGEYCLSHRNIPHCFCIHNDHTYTAKIEAKSRGPSHGNRLAIFLFLGHSLINVHRDYTEDLEELSMDLENAYRLDRYLVGRLTCREEGFAYIHPFILLSRDEDFSESDFGVGSSFDFGMSLNYLRKFVRYLYTGRVDGMSNDKYGADFLIASTINHFRAHYLFEAETYRRQEHFPARKRRKIVFLGFHDGVNASHDICGRRYKRVFFVGNFSLALEVLPGHTTGTWLKYTGTSSSNRILNFEVEIGVIKDDTCTYVHGERHTLLSNGDEVSSTNLLFLGSRNVFGNLLDDDGKIQLSIALKFRQGSPLAETKREAGSTDPILPLLSLADSFGEGLRTGKAADMVLEPRRGDPIRCHKVMFRARLHTLSSFGNAEGLLENGFQTFVTRLSSEHVICILKYMYTAIISDDLRNHRYNEVRLFAIANNIVGLKRFFHVEDD